MEFRRTKKLQELISCRNNGLIKIITGIRRCGKSYLMNTIFYDYLLRSGFPERHIIRFAFDRDDDLDKLEGILPEEPTKIFLNRKKEQYVVNSRKFRTYIAEQTTEPGEYILLLDEIQNLQEFYGTLNGFLYHSDFDVYVTGSNSHLLSSDIATEFRGRGDTVCLQPLTFTEVWEELGGDKRKVLDDYLLYGGLPLCVLAPTPERKINYLNTVYQTVYLKDIKDRNGIRNEVQLQELVRILSSGIGTLTNPKKIANTFHSKEKTSITEKTVSKYNAYLEDAYLVHSSQRYDIKGRRYISTPKKYYFSDLGIRNAVLNFRQFEKTHLMENLIYNELLYRGFCVDVGNVEILEEHDGSYRRKNCEVDFVANRIPQRYYIQSAYSIEDAEKKEQEEKSLNHIEDGFNKVIIVYDATVPYRNEKGYLVLGLLDFLSDEHILEKY